MIESSNNQQIKNIQLLLEKPKARRQNGLFVAEGIKMFLEAPDSWIYRVYVSEEFMSKSIHAKRVQKHPHEIVSTQVFKKMSDTKAPQGILTVLRIPRYNSEELFKKENGTYLILNTIQDPGNLGTMMRTGEGAGISAVIMDRECVDIFNPKVIRSTMGSIYRVPFIIADDLKATINEMKSCGIKMVAAHLKGEHSFYDESFSGSVGIMIGNEGNGLEDEISELSDIRVRIPMEGKLESLNAAVSAALLMYEIKRQRA